jgi:hypothetical protein
MPPKKHRLFGEKGVLDRRELSTHRKSDAMYPQPWIGQVSRQRIGNLQFSTNHEQLQNHQEIVKQQNISFNMQTLENYGNLQRNQAKVLLNKGGKNYVAYVTTLTAR